MADNPEGTTSIDDLDDLADDVLEEDNPEEAVSPTAIEDIIDEEVVMEEEESEIGENIMTF